MNRKLGNVGQVCSVYRSLVTDGRGKGARILTVSNGRLNFIVLESNACDILRLWHEGMNVGFLSKGGLYTPDEDFLHNFPAGMLYTCGLNAIGGVEGHYPHGRLHRTPAEIVGLDVTEAGVRIVAEIRDSALFGANLVLQRTIETKAYADEVTVTDVLCNESFLDAKYCLLYHVNVGYPMTDVGARVEADIVRTLPRNECARKCMKTMLEVEPPVDGAEENCFFHETKDGAMSLVNPKLGKRFTVKCSLKKFVQWKSRASGDYVMALEPCTSWLDGHLAYRTLKPGRKATVRLSLGLTALPKRGRV